MVAAGFAGDVDGIGYLIAGFAALDGSDIAGAGFSFFLDESKIAFGGDVGDGPGRDQRGGDAVFGVDPGVGGDAGDVDLPSMGPDGPDDGEFGVS